MSFVASGLKTFDRKTELQIGVKFEKSGHLGGKEGLMKDVTELHYGKYGKKQYSVFSSFTHARDLK